MGNNPSRPAGAHSHSRSRSTSRFQTQDRAFPKRSFTTPARGKYDRYDYEEDEEGRESEYVASRAPHNPFQSAMPAHQMGGYYVHPYNTMSPNTAAQYPVFPQPQMQPGINPVVPGMPMNGAIPTAGNPFPGPPMNMPMPEPVIPPGMGAGLNHEGPVIPPLPHSRRGRMSTPYHPPHHMYDARSEDEYTDELDSEARERLQPPLLPGQYGPHDPVRDRRRTPAPALRRGGHRRAESSPGYGRDESPPFDDVHDRVIPPPPHVGGPPFPGFPGHGHGQFAQHEMGGARMEMREPEPETTTHHRRFTPFQPSHNPLPPPPKDILNSSPYARIIRELRKPIDENAIMASAPAIHTIGAVNVSAPVHPQMHTHHTGTRSSKEKKRKGLFRSISTRITGSRRFEDEPESPPQSAPGGVPVQMVGGQSTHVYPIVQHLPDGSTQLIYNPPGAAGYAGAAFAPAPPPGVMSGYAPAAGSGGAGSVNPPPPVIPQGANIPRGAVSRGPSPSPVPGMQSPGPGRMSTPQPMQQHPPSPIPQPPPPAVKLERNSELLHFALRRVHYAHKSWPTGAHLFEAFKFLPDRPDLAERIRNCATPEEAITIADGLSQYSRRDWNEVRMDRLEEVLYHKMMQNPDLRLMLMQTGRADIIFSDPDTTWGDGQIGQGHNLLGNALMNVRERLRHEGLDS